MRLLVLAAVVTVVFFLFYSSGVDPKQDSRKIQDFYHKTMDGMKNGSPPGQAVINAKTGERAGHIPADKDADGDVDEDDRKVAAELQMRLKKAEQEAKDKANTKGGLKPDVPSKVVGKGNSAGGQPKDDTAVAKDSGQTADKTKPKPKEVKEETEAEAELNTILKKAPGKYHCSPSPTQTFSKSHAISHHLFQDVLPLFQASQGRPPRQVHHQPRTIRRRTGRAPPRTQLTSRP